MTFANVVFLGILVLACAMFAAVRAARGGSWSRRPRSIAGSPTSCTTAFVTGDGLSCPWPLAVHIANTATTAAQVIPRLGGDR